MADRADSHCHFHVFLDGEGGLGATAFASAEEEAARLLRDRVRGEMDRKYVELD